MRALVLTASVVEIAGENRVGVAAEKSDRGEIDDRRFTCRATRDDATSASSRHHSREVDRPDALL